MLPAALDWLLQTAAGHHIEARIYSRRESLHAPHLTLEIAQVLRRLVRERALTPQRADEAIEDMLSLPITRYAHDVFLSKIWSYRHNLSAYDATYVTLAERLGAVLLTRDHKLASACSALAGVKVEVL